jgi:antitoxin HicB
MKTEHRTLAYYMALPYTKILQRDQDDDIVARVEELPGCSAHGATDQEALTNLQEAKMLWLEDCLGAGDPVPEPEKPEAPPSGKWLQRVPRSLHAQLVKQARKEGVSLNQLVTFMLSEIIAAKGIQSVVEQIIAKCAAPVTAQKSMVPPAFVRPSKAPRGQARSILRTRG